MIVWGSAGDVLNLGPRESKECATCERSRPFDLMLQYRYGGLYWVFNFVMERKYMLLCSVCGRGWALDQRQIEKEVGAVPIPFMRRYGLAMLAATVCLVGFLL